MHGWKKLAALTVLSLVLLCFLTTIGFAQKNLPKLHIREKSVDIGEVFEGEDVVYDFVVRNMGSADLQILNVRPG